MKTLLLIIIPFLLSGQRLDVKDLNGTSYLIQTDTSTTGIITVTKTPMSEVAIQLDAKILDIQSKIDYLISQIAIMNAQKKEYTQQLKQAQDLRAQFQPLPLKVKKKKRK